MQRLGRAGVQQAAHARELVSPVVELSAQPQARQGAHQPLQRRRVAPHGLCQRSVVVRLPGQQVRYAERGRGADRLHRPEAVDHRDQTLAL